MIVDLLPTEDQAAIRDSVAGVLAKELPISRLHDPANTAGAKEREIWPTLAELGLFGLGVAEERGGIGYTLAEAVTVARELGKHLVSPTVMATMLAARIAGTELLEEVVNGQVRVAFANPLGDVDFSATDQDFQIVDGAEADYVIVWNDDQVRLYPLPTALRQIDCIDDTVAMARATVALTEPVANSTSSEDVKAVGLMLSAYLAGMSEATLTMAVEYGKVREQFNQPIGAFQAIKHYCADMARRSEAAVAQTFYATLDTIERGDGDPFEVAAARLLCADAALTNARFNIQIHGGMGYTYEADAHFFLKRAWLCSVLGGGERAEQRRIMASRAPA